MPRYYYKCPNCAHTYLEQRTSDEQQYISVCNSCGLGNYILIDEKPITS